ncbi:MAG: glycerate kinase [Mogibacterium sp.]|nr:glycerate kinase [Mogibacterium sp.]
MENLRKDAETIARAAIAAVMPDEAVKRALEGMVRPSGRLVLVAVGKAAWQMAKAATNVVKPDSGIVITKYDHVMGELPNIECREAGHPIPDVNSFDATARALDIVGGLGAGDCVLFLLSGGGSALFESPLISEEELKDITKQLLASGADIVEMNTVRKRLSAVKGGRFALACKPARIYSIVLSDILGDPLDMIASGPACPDSSTSEDAFAIVEKYGLRLSDEALRLLGEETPKALDNVTTVINGSVRELCRAAEQKCRELGYETVFLSDRICCEAADAGSFLAAIARSHAGKGRKAAFVAGGETLVHVRGTGLGGRNQEIALSAATLLDGLNAAVFSVGSDGTDGPTDAAGGYADGETLGRLKEKGLDAEKYLANNDAYHALKAVDSLIITEPTGTNVNDLSVVLVAE